MEENDVTDMELEDRLAFYRMEVERLGLPVDVSEPELEDVAPLGEGSIGKVRIAVDRVLGRTVAVKTLQPHLSMRSDQIERMVREVQAAAQLEHPNIVPVYSLGISPQNGVYFTMKRLRGDSLRHIIIELANGNPAYTWVYTWSRRLSIFTRICQGMAYAHSKQVLHRDLKPENVRIGNYGEVTIIDWGLVRGVQRFGNEKWADTSRRDNYGEPGDYELEEMVSTSNPTMDGEVSGTPRYMSPEQANGQVSSLDARSDIYSLGVILYELMTCCNPFSEKNSEKEILDAVKSGSFQRPRHYPGARHIPVEMEMICLKALSLNPDGRYQSVTELLADVYAHQEGRPVKAYRGTVVTSLRRCFQRNPLRSVAFFSMLTAIVIFAFVIHVFDVLNYRKYLESARTSFNTAEKMWEDEDSRIKARITARMPVERDSVGENIDLHYETALFFLNSIPPRLRSRLPVVKLREEVLAKRLLRDISAGRMTELGRHLDYVKNWYRGDFSNCSEQLRAAVSMGFHIINGDSTIASIDTSVHPAKVHVIPVNDSRSQSFDVSEAGINEQGIELPAKDVYFPKGEYMMFFAAEGRPVVRYHLFVSDRIPDNIRLDIPTRIPDGFCYVPAGKACIGGTSVSDRGVLQEIPGFFIGKHEVSFGEYLEFWRQLPAELKQRYVPRINIIQDQAPQEAWNDSGILSEHVRLDRPVVGVNAAAADAYCRWFGGKIGRICRLPSEAEWEKAARGVNGRLYPWGDHFKEELAFLRENISAHIKYGHWAPGGSFPQDCSLFGVLDMAGNVREWTSSLFNDGTGLRVIKGASASAPARYLPLGRAHDLPLSPSDVGFRVLLPLIPEDIAED